LSGNESAGFASFVYICIAIIDAAIKRGGFEIPLNGLTNQGHTLLNNP